MEQAFILDQRKSRKMAIGKIDIVTTKKMIKRSDRKLAAKQRATRLIIASRNTEKTTSDIDEDEEITFQKRNRFRVHV